MRRVKLLLLCLCISTFSFAGELKLAVAANVQSAFGELEAAFNKSNPDVKLVANFGSSGAFRTQIKNGADFDIYLSADMGFPEEVFDAGLAQDKPVVYAQGALALFSTKKLDFTKGLELLRENSIKKISIANPQTAPYGRASVEAMNGANVYSEVQGKLVQAESIGQVVAQTLSAADIGFVAKSALYSPKMSSYKEDVNWISVDPALYTPINQGVVILKNAKNKDDAQAFYNFLLSDEGKKVFKDFGYNVP